MPNSATLRLQENASQNAEGAEVAVSQDRTTLSSSTETRQKKNVQNNTE